MYTFLVYIKLNLYNSRERFDGKSLMMIMIDRSGIYKSRNYRVTACGT